MATASGFSAKSLIECTICLEEFTRPKLLPCHHTFCALCLENYIERNKKGSQFECPLCRKSIEIPSKGVEEFQTNFYIDSSQPGSKLQDVPCDACSKGSPADHHCIDCEENFCSHCTEAHMNMKATRLHKLIEVKTDDQGIGRRIKSRVFCTKHPRKEIEVICKQCDKLLCLMCMLMDHQGHLSREIIDEAREVKELLERIIANVRLDELVERQTKSKEKLNKTNSGLRRCLQNEAHRVENHAAEICKVVNLAMKSRKEELKKVYTELIEEHDKEIKHSDTYCTSMKSLVATAVQVIEQGTDYEILEKGRCLCARLVQERKKEPKSNEGIETHESRTLFREGNIDANGLRQMMGNVLKMTDVCNQKTENTMKQRIHLTPINDRVQLIRSITASGAGGNGVVDISTISNNRAWISYSSRRFELVEITGNSLLTVDIWPRCFAVTADPNGNCIVSCPDSQSIKRVTTAGRIENIVTGMNFGSNGLAYRKTVSGKEEILFSVNTSGRVHAAPYQLNSNPVLWAEGMEGIFGVAVDKVTNKVCTCSYSGARVTILDEAGKVLTRYHENRFLPFRCSFDIQGCILVSSDRADVALSRIKLDGTLFEVLTNITGRCVATDSQNRIWVGKDNGQIDIYEVRQ